MSLFPKEEAVIKLLEEDTAYKNYFFNKVDDLKWFDALKEKGYFDPKNVPGPQPGDQKGFYSIPWWNVLSYLEKVSEQLTVSGNEKYIDELLNIIKEVSTYTDAEGKHIDNYHTWRSFTTILNNIPREKIPSNMIELMPTWLNSKFDVSHVGSEIGLKLLPKFLSGKSSGEDITKAELIINYITDTKSIKLDKEQAKLYDKEEKVDLKIKAYWISEIFKKNSEDIGAKCTNDVIYDLCERITSLLQRDVSLITLEAGDKSYLLSLSIEDDKYFVKVFDLGDKSTPGVHEYLFSLKKIAHDPIKRFSLDKCTWDDFTSAVFDEIAKDDPFKSSNTKYLKRHIHNLYRNFHDSETYSSLYDESRSHLKEPLEVLTFVLKSILMAKARKGSDDTKEILTQFFADKYMYFPKMALYIIGNNINSYNDVFWDAIEKDISNLIFGEIYFGDELRHVLERLSDISDLHKKLLIEKIEQGPGYKPGEDTEIYIAKWKQKIYGALIKDDDFQAKYDALKNKTGVDVSLHAAVGEIRSRWGEGPSPLTKEEIIQMLPDNKLNSYLKGFKSAGFWEESPTVGGLAHLIKECATEQPNKFINNLPPLIDTGFIYIYEILEGVREAWNKKQNIGWGKLFEFVIKYINRGEFWLDHFVVQKDDFLGGANHLWVVGSLTELIREGSNDDSWAYSEEHFEIAEVIIFIILNHLKPDDESDITDYVTHTINSPHGKAITALINHTLRLARFNDKSRAEEPIKWSKRIKDRYDGLLKGKIIESYTLLGRYLSNFIYLDKSWAEEQVIKLYPDATDQYWEAFMDGYLSIGTVYNDFYELMTPHYIFAISHEFKEKRDNEHLVQHIALGYLLGFDPRGLDEPETLIKKVLNAWKPEQILDILSFLWSQQKYIGDEKNGNNEIIEKIIAFWKWVYENNYKTKPELEMTDFDKKIQSSLSQLTVFLPSITAEYSEWLLYAAPYADENYNASFFIEYLDKYDDESMKYVGQIYLKMLDYSTPSYDKEHIRSIVGNLYKHGCKDKADKICITYGRREFGFLRDLYDKYNS